MRNKNLTTEHIKADFPNSFDLVNYLIKLAINYIDSGREPFVPCQERNPVQIVLKELAAGKDQFVEEDEDDAAFPDEGLAIAGLKSVREAITVK